MLQSGVQGMLYGAAGDDAALSTAILQVLALPDHGTRWAPPRRSRPCDP